MKMSRSQKETAESMKLPTHVWYVIRGDYYLHDLGSNDAKYILEEIFDDVLSGAKNDEDAGVSPGDYCILKLD